ncbi:MAG TPA: response regulator transcription factor [Myxococcales bacterium]|nr:response regulator transcription factor [Myxococcales bacterium]
MSGAAMAGGEQGGPLPPRSAEQDEGEVWLTRRVTRALLIEDDRKLSSLLVEFLGQNGIEAVAAEDANAALSALGAGRFDILLVDLMLPGMDGLTLTRRIRERWNTPLIMVTARGDDADKIVGLELGADDYLAKPFNPRELLARIRAVLRRAQGESSAEGRFAAGGLVIDFDAREVAVDGKRMSLTAHEFDILVALARNSGRVLSRDQLLELVKGDGADEAFDRSIDVHVSRLRAKIEPDPRHPRYVKTVRGAGYLLAREG